MAKCRLSFSLITSLCLLQLEVPNVIPKVVTGKSKPFVVARNIDERIELSLNIYHPGPQPELPSAARRLIGESVPKVKLIS